MSAPPPPDTVPLLKRILHMLRGEDASSAAMRESLEEVIEESERQSAPLGAQERVMLANLLAFGELKLQDVMVPRADIMAVDETLTVPELVAIFREAQHSRLPVYRETLDDPTGLVHVKDVLALLETMPDGDYRLARSSIAALKRPILFAPPSMRALDLLMKMQASHTHLALVIDEYGGTDGLVSIEDIIEEIVGDIADEHDEDAPALVRDGSGYIADARLELEDFKTETGIDLAQDHDGDVDSLGGLVVSLLGRVPQRGEIVPGPANTLFEVLDADPRRIKRVRIRIDASSSDIYSDDA
jgi:CBS domain containing-hemolysin-like protein